MHPHGNKVTFLKLQPPPAPTPRTRARTHTQKHAQTRLPPRHTAAPRPPQLLLTWVRQSGEYITAGRRGVRARLCAGWRCA